MFLHRLNQMFRCISAQYSFLLNVPFLAQTSVAHLQAFYTSLQKYVQNWINNITMHISAYQLS